MAEYVSLKVIAARMGYRAATSVITAVRRDGLPAYRRRVPGYQGLVWWIDDRMIDLWHAARAATDRQLLIDSGRYADTRLRHISAYRAAHEPQWKRDRERLRVTRSIGCGCIHAESLSEPYDDAPHDSPADAPIDETEIDCQVHPEGAPIECENHDEAEIEVGVEAEKQIVSPVVLRAVLRAEGAPGDISRDNPTRTPPEQPATEPRREITLTVAQLEADRESMPRITNEPRQL